MFTWKAIYSKNSCLNQYNEDSSENLYKDIDRARLTRFELFNDGKLVYSLFLHKGQRLIFRRRNFISYTKDSEKRWTMYLVGYQFNDETGKNYKVLNYIHENGFVELDNDRQDLVVIPEIEG